MLNQLQIQNLGKKIGYHRILSDINMTLRKGDLIVIYGPNGAGKTTLLKIIAGLIRKSTGMIFWDKQSFEKHKKNLIKKIGFIGEDLMVFQALTVQENLVFYNKIYNQHERMITSKVINRVGLEHYVDERVNSLSSGLRQRLKLAQVLLYQPSLILYDEPFVGLDMRGKKILLSIIKAYQKTERIQMIVTHNFRELEKVKYQFIELESGRIRKERRCDD